MEINKISSKKKLENILFEADYNYGRLWKLVRGWRGKIPFYSVMQGGGVHMIDLILNICKDLPVQVKAYGNKIVTKKTNFNFNDLSVAILKFKDGKILKVTSISVAWLHIIIQLKYLDRKELFLTIIMELHILEVEIKKNNLLDLISNTLIKKRVIC